MSKDQFKFRILNKSKEGAIVKLASGDQVFYSWTDFNKCFIIIDQKWAVFNEEMQKRQDEVESKLSMLCVYVHEQKVKEFRGENYDLTSMAVIGSLSQELQRELDCTPAQLMMLVQQRLSAINPFLSGGMPKYREFRIKKSKDGGWKTVDKVTDKPKDSIKTESTKYGVNLQSNQSMADVKGADKLREMFKN